MHSKIQSYRILDKYKNRGKACGLPVVKKIDFRFSRHWKLRLFRSKANIFTRLSNNTAKLRVVKMWKLAKTYVWLIQPRKKLHQLWKCGPAIFSHVEFRGSTHVLRRFSQPIRVGRVQMEAPAFSTLFLAFSILFRLNLTSPFIKQARSKVFFFQLQGRTNI